uniref:SET domain-containing protein n=1 Tax=Romanomermis culicivorax TaxID=13658 RepID=A0A915L7B0_ROMCU
MMKQLDDGALGVLSIVKWDIHNGEQLLFDYGDKYAKNILNNCPCDELLAEFIKNYIQYFHLMGI